MLRTQLVSIAFLSLSIGCSSVQETPASSPDTGVADTGSAVDTGKVDTGTADMGPLPGCETELGSDFACTAPTKSMGGTACTDAMLLDFVQKCLAADLTVPSACSAWKTENAACASCIGTWSWDELPGKVYPDDYKCYWSTFDATCAKSVNCLFACQAEVCQECTDEDANKCYSDSQKSGGRCWDVAGKAADACFKSTDTSGCDVNEMYASDPDLTTMREEVLKYYRGACRDNANWKNATMPSGDAGPDAPASETSVSDAAGD